MPTPRQFFDLLRRITNSPRNVYDGTGKRIGVQRAGEIETDILEKREPWKAEYLDAKFYMFNGRMYIGYNHRFIDRHLQPMNSEPLEMCLIEEGYIDLRSINRQGLPTRRSKKQNYSQGENIYFWPPEHNSVARFEASSSGVGLGCGRSPYFSVAGLSVRSAKIREK